MINLNVDILNPILNMFVVNLNILSTKRVATLLLQAAWGPRSHGTVLCSPRWFSITSDKHRILPPLFSPPNKWKYGLQLTKVEETEPLWSSLTSRTRISGTSFCNSACSRTNVTHVLLRSNSPVLVCARKSWVDPSTEKRVVLLPPILLPPSPGQGPDIELQSAQPCPAEVQQ